MDQVVETLHAPHGTKLTPQLSMPSEHKLTFTVQFDLAEGADEFGEFCGALLAGGFESVVLGMAAELMAEAKRRNISLPSLERAMGEPCASTSKE